MSKLLGFVFSFAFLIITYHLLLITPANAAGEFETSYKVRYSIEDTGKTQVTQNVVLKNKTTNYYADKFELKIGSTKVDDVVARDNAGPLETNVKFENNVTTISVKFNQKVIGIDKELPWSLSYKSNELSSRSGQIWEVSIPRLAKSSDIGSYEATVVTPASFGPVAFAVPSPLTSTKLGINQEFTFNREQLVESGIAMSFGIKQVFSFSLDYYLDNPNLTAQVQEIALPPDNNYQKIVMEKIEPTPLDVEVDKDNNFIATYRLGPKESVNIRAQGYVEVFSKPFRNLYPKLTNEQRQKYMEPAKYWETDNSFIKDKAKELKTPEEIYKFVSNYLSYSEDRLNQPDIDRKGAVLAVAEPKDSVCMEFTDLFIAIARAAGIPSREVEGYAYTQNERLRPLSLALASGDILHAWPEYWDDNLGWVQIDPTWASTSGGLDFFNKLDFNHITFVHRGLSSVEPYPAGSYKKVGNMQKKDIDIAFAAELPNVTSTPQLALNRPDKILGGIPVKVTAEVKNIGTSSIIGEKLSLRTSFLTKSGDLHQPKPATGEYESLVDVAILPPFATDAYSFSLSGNSLWKKVSDTIVLSYHTTQISVPVEIIPIYSLIFLRGFLISLGAAFVFILVGLLLYRRILKKHRRFKAPPQVFN